MKIADFFAEIGFKVDTKSLRQFNDGMTTVANSVKGLALNLTSAMTAWELLQLKIGKGAQQMLNFKTYTGENIEEVRKLASVMQSTNLNFSMDTLLSDITNFKVQLRELQLFGQGSSLGRALRVMAQSGVKTGAMDTISDFLNAVKQVPDEATRLVLLRMAGLSDQFMNILDLPQDKYEEFAARADKLFPDEKELKRRQEATLEIYLAWRELVNLFETKVTDFAPVLLDILNRLKDIVSDSEKLKLVLEGVKWTFILSTLGMIGGAIWGIVGGLRAIMQFAPLAFVALMWKKGREAGRVWNEGHGVDDDSKEGKRNQNIGGAVGAGAGAITVAGVYQGLKKLFGSKAARKVALKVGGKAAARHAAAGGLNLAPWVLGGLIAWDLWDVGKGIYDITKMNSPVDTLKPTTSSNSDSNPSLPSLPPHLLNENYNNSNYDWNSMLANMTINAQNVYVNANRVVSQNSTGQTLNPQTPSSTTAVNNNIMRANFNMEKW